MSAPAKTSAHLVYLAQSGTMQGGGSQNATMKPGSGRRTSQKQTDSEDGQTILALTHGSVNLLSGQAGVKERMRRLTNKQLFVEEVTFLIPIGGNS